MVISLLICHIITFGFTVYSLVWVLGQLRIKAGAQNVSVLQEKIMT